MSARSGDSGPPSRRRVLKGGLSCLAAGVWARPGRAAEGEVSGRTVVLLHLSGGNDGLNTVIPYADPLYHAARPRLSRVARQVLAINEEVGFHPSLRGFYALYRSGQLAIVEGVGSREPDYSHVGSCGVWAGGIARLHDGVRGSWAGGAMGRPTALSVLARPAGATIRPIAQTGGEDAAGGVRGEWPPCRIPLGYWRGQTSEVLGAILRMVGSARPPAIIRACVGGFDTHEDQLDAHEEVLRELGDGLAAFQRGLADRGVAERVVLAAWSEFGRRIAENAMGGTDHGSAGPVFLLGRSVRGGLYGRRPSLGETDFGNLIATVDYGVVFGALARRGIDRRRWNESGRETGMTHC